MNIYHREFLDSQKKIQKLDDVKSEDLTDAEYETYWYKKNTEYKFFIYCLMKYTERYSTFDFDEYHRSTRNYPLLHSVACESWKIGQDTGFFMNRISKKLIKLDFKYIYDRYFLSQNQKLFEGVIFD